MTTAYDVPPDKLIKRIAEKLKQDKTFTPPEWARFVKTGPHVEKPPMDPEWWYIRCASILRKIYIKKCIGIERLRAEYGGKKDKGSKPYHAVKGSGSIVRKALQQLESAGYITKIRGKGRVITPKGQSFVDNTAHEVKLELEKEIPELSKY